MPDKWEVMKVKAGVLYRTVSFVTWLPGHEDNVLESPVQLGGLIRGEHSENSDRPRLCSGQAHDCLPLALPS